MRRVDPPALPTPHGYSHAVVATGRLVFLAGQTAPGASLPEQFEGALGRLLTALEAAGGRPAHLASLTIYATDLGSYREQTPALGEIWRRLVGRDYPAMAAVGVTRLWDDDSIVELQAIAVLPAE